MTTYRHFKGGRYRILMTGLADVHDFLTVAMPGHAIPASMLPPDLVETVIYCSLGDGRIYVRPRSSWDDIVTWPDGQRRKRFVREDFEQPSGYREAFQRADDWAREELHPADYQSFRKATIGESEDEDDPNL